MKVPKYPQEDCCPLCKKSLFCPHACPIAEEHPVHYRKCDKDCYEPCWNEGEWKFKSYISKNCRGRIKQTK